MRRRLWVRRRDPHTPGGGTSAILSRVGRLCVWNRTQRSAALHGGWVWRCWIMARRSRRNVQAGTQASTIFGQRLDFGGRLCRRGTLSTLILRWRHTCCGGHVRRLRRQRWSLRRSRLDRRIMWLLSRCRRFRPFGCRHQGLFGGASWCRRSCGLWRRCHVGLGRLKRRRLRHGRRCRGSRLDRARWFGRRSEGLRKCHGRRRPVREAGPPDEILIPQVAQLHELHQLDVGQRTVLLVVACQIPLDRLCRASHGTLSLGRRGAL